MNEKHSSSLREIAWGPSSVVKTSRRKEAFAKNEVKSQWPIYLTFYLSFSEHNSYALLLL